MGLAAGAIAGTIASGIVVFASTNIDDIVLLSLLFADRDIRPRSVVLGQFLGIGALVAASVVAGLAAVAIPPGWTALLGVVPLLLGLYKMVKVLRERHRVSKEDDDASPKLDVRRSQMLAVAGITIANGADNLSLYIPLFAAERQNIVFYILVFAVMTGLWCAFGFKLVNNRSVGARLRRYGHIILPLVLIALGAHILSGVRVLL